MVAALDLGSSASACGFESLHPHQIKDSKMYKVVHTLPSGEWGSVEVGTLCEAEQWFHCKLKSRSNATVTLYCNDRVVKSVSS